MFELVLLKPALKFYKKSDKDLCRRLVKAFKKIEENPFVGKDIKKLRGKLSGFYRYKVNDVRIVYFVDKEKRKVNVVDIGYRGGIYQVD
ncbi:MAG: type II toxin-antitoxin system RelE/ParE family toxin [Candidatus Eremiobacteraeota bacterium]|nr:type II toxin-antitoxin system RelE/ParE family toxin [Candidatus Eremiobacteraeota bacterium]